MVIALTGGCCSGKSTAANVFRKLNIPVLDADALSRELTAPGGKALPAYRAAFGDGVFQADGQLDRRALRQLILQDPTQREKINEIIHPLIWEAFETRIKEWKQQGQGMILLDIPLLFETGMEKLADKVICIYVPKEVQIARIMERDRASREMAQAMIEAQMPTEEKIKRSDFAVNSDRPIEETAEIIGGIIEQLRESKHESLG